MRKGQSGPLSGGAHYWSVIRRLASENDGLFTINKLFAETGGVRRTGPSNYVLALLADGHVEVVSVRHWGGRCEKTYRLLTTNRAVPPVLSRLHNKRDTQRLQMWRAMRALQSFTIRELSCAASTEETVVTDAVAQNYLWWLRRAGYVVLIGRIGTVGHYRLVRRMNTGPSAPVVDHRANAVLDRNTGKVVNLNGEPTKGWAA